MEVLVIGLLSTLRHWKSGEPTAGKNVTLDQLIDLLNLGGVEEGLLSEATYFACLKVLSESIGKLPLKLLETTANNSVRPAYEHPLYNVLRYRPNPYMTGTAFWSTVEFNRNHYGNAYCLITEFGAGTKLWILPSDHVQIWYDDAKLLSDVTDIWYIYTCAAGIFKFSSEEVLHFRTSSTLDGIKGLSVREILRTTLVGNQKAQKMLNRLYENGFTAKAVVQYTGNLNDENEKIFTKKIQDFATGRDMDIKSIIPLPAGATIQPLNIKLTDAEFLEIKKYSALQIAAAFGVKPNQINDYEKASYASAEAQQLAFYVDTLLYPLKQYEEEIGYKLLTADEMKRGLRPKFNVSVILRADIKTQIDTLSAAVGNFIYTPNEARAMLDMESKPGGNQLIGNGSTIPIQQVGNQYAKGGDKENEESDT